MFVSILCKYNFIKSLSIHNHLCTLHRYFVHNYLRYQTRRIKVRFFLLKMVWKRPKDIPYPMVWSEFTSERNNQKFIVKDLVPEYYDISLGYMTNMFLNESAVCKPLKIFEDHNSRLQMQRKWLEIMKENMSLICVTEDDEVSRVAAIHFTKIRNRGGKDIQEASIKEDKFSAFSKVVEELKDEGELFERFGVDHYLGSLGLFVLPEFRGLGIATEILKARITMCKTLGLLGTATVFSTDGAQAAARKAGYKTIATKCFKGKELAVMGVKISEEKK